MKASPSNGALRSGGARKDTPLTVLVVTLTLLALVSAIGSALYFDGHPILKVFIPNEAAFWEGRLSADEIGGFLAWLAAWLLGLALLFVGLREAAFVRALASVWHAFHRDAWRSTYVFYLVAALAVIGYTTLRFVCSNQYYGGASLHLLTEGAALAPFQYRTLIPWLVALLDHVNLFPATSVASLYWGAEALSAFLVVLAFGAYLKLFFDDEQVSRWLGLTILLPLFCLLAAPIRSYAVLYPYDTPSVLFFILGLTFLYRRAWLPYYVVFVVGTFNRETTCFLAIIFFITALRDTRFRTIVLHCGAQLILWLAVKYLLFELYAGRPVLEPPRLPAEDAFGGGVFESYVYRNIVFLANPLSYFYLLAAMNGLWIPVALLGRSIKDHFVKYALLVVVPFGVGMFLVGILAEVRIYGELTPLVLTAFLLLVKARFEETSAVERADAPSPQLAMA